MKRVVLKHIPLRTNPWDKWFQRLPPFILSLFLLQYGLVWWRVVSPRPIFENARWPDGLLVVFTAATILMILARQLPAQNVMIAALIVASIGAAVHSLGALTGVPFGPFTFHKSIGQELFHPLPWAIPLVWIIVVISSRGVARLVLRPWRTHRVYGFWLMGVTALLVVILIVNLEPFATQVKHFWRWHPTRTKLHWYTAPWVNFVGWAVITLLILAFVTPWLINKKPVKPAPPEYHSLLVWVLLNFLFGTGALVHKLWSAAILAFTLSLIALGLALFGAKSPEPVRSVPSAR